MNIIIVVSCKCLIHIVKFQKQNVIECIILKRAAYFRNVQLKQTLYDSCVYCERCNIIAILFIHLCANEVYPLYAKNLTNVSFLHLFAFQTPKMYLHSHSKRLLKSAFQMRIGVINLYNQYFYYHIWCHFYFIKPIK